MAKRRTPRTSEPLTDDRILDAKELLERIPLDRSTIWRLIDAGKFPRPLQITANRIGWRLSSVLRWIADREADPLTATSRDYFGRDKATSNETDAA